MKNCTDCIIGFGSYYKQNNWPLTDSKTTNRP